MQRLEIDESFTPSADQVNSAKLLCVARVRKACLENGVYELLGLTDGLDRLLFDLYFAIRFARNEAQAPLATDDITMVYQASEAAIQGTVSTLGAIPTLTLEERFRMRTIELAANELASHSIRLSDDGSKTEVAMTREVVQSLTPKWKSALASGQPIEII